MSKREIKPNEVYLPRRGRSGLGKRRCRKFRRVIDVRDGVVVYSSGGDKNYFCSLGAFKDATQPEPVVASCLESCDDLLNNMNDLAQDFFNLVNGQAAIDDDGYPTDAALERVRTWPCERYGELMSLIKRLWRYGDMPSIFAESDTEDELHKRKVREYCLSTVGWSGNESIIHAMRENFMFWGLCWVEHRRGGHFKLYVPQDYL